MATLERAITIAAEAHAGQLDKAGASYILHPLRVMLSLETENERIVGVLHDVVEDCCDWTFERLIVEGFSSEIIEALKSVTKNHSKKNPIVFSADAILADESYHDFVIRACRNPIGRRVKLADLTDNCDLSRISHPSSKDYERVQKYRDAIAYIQSKTFAE
jgi:(p)ppGpp synthase/HD superfamily hydrolase